MPCKTHFLNTHSQYTLSIHLLNTPSQHTYHTLALLLIGALVAVVIPDIGLLCTERYVVVDRSMW